ncbi:CHAP domain-containing protein [Streptococcus sp. E24BD]|uniref:CHAP domain-containing protein n=1 Tax=Streptococcus sp. E24BD TaxID=3278715 RepID=UPI00359DBED5
MENQGTSGFRRAGGNYVGDGCVRWVKDRARGLLGIGLPNTGYNKYGLAGASAYWDLLPRHGYQRGGEPAKNSLAVWEETIVSVGGTYKYRHVAYVEEVQGDNIVLSQGGMPSSRHTWGGHVGVQHATFHKSQMDGTSIARKFLGYVYLREKPIPPISPAPPVQRYDVNQLASQHGQTVSDGDLNRLH